MALRGAIATVLVCLVGAVWADPSQRRFLPQYYYKHYELGENNLNGAPKDSSIKNGEIKLSSFGREKEVAKEGFLNGHHPFPPLIQKPFAPLLHADVDYSTTSDQVPEDFEERERRKFPEVDSRGFDEDIFDEGFGEWQPMKRW